MLVRYTFFSSNYKCLPYLSLKFHVLKMLLHFNTALACRMTIYATYHAQIKKIASLFFCMSPRHNF